MASCNKHCPKIVHIRFIPLAIVSFSLMPIFKICSIRYVYERLANDNGYDLHPSANFTEEDIFIKVDNSSVVIFRDELEDLVQVQAARFNMLFVIVHSICNSVSMPLWGALSDRLGRKVPIIMSTIGSMIHIAAVMLVFHYHLPLWVILFGLAVHCFFGNQPYTICCAGRTFICDNVGSERKIFEITLHALWLTIGSTLGSLASGFLIHHLEYLFATLVVLAFQPLIIIYVAIFIPKFKNKSSKSSEEKNGSVGVEDEEDEEGEEEDTCPQEIKEKLLCAKGIIEITTKSIRVMFFADKNRKEIILLIIIHIMCTAGFSCDTFLLVYVQGAPMYWEARTIGFFLAGSGMLVGLASPVITFIWKRGGWSRHWLMLLGIISGVLRYTIYGISQHTYVQFIAVIAGMLYYIPYQASLGMVSDLVPKESQGALVSGATTAQLIVSLATTVLFNYLYGATLVFYPGTVFFVAAAFYCFCIPLIIYAKHLHNKREKPTDEEQNMQQPQQQPSQTNSPLLKKQCHHTLTQQLSIG